MEKVANIHDRSTAKGKHTKVEVVSINSPSKEDAQAKIRELSEYLSVAWVSPDSYE